MCCVFLNIRTQNIMVILDTNYLNKDNVFYINKKSAYYRSILKLYDVYIMCIYNT